MQRSFEVPMLDQKEHKRESVADETMEPLAELQALVRNYLNSTHFHYADNGTPFFLNPNCYSHHRVCKEILNHKSMEDVITSLNLYLSSSIQLNKNDPFFILLQQFFSRYEHYYMQLSDDSRKKLSVVNQFTKQTNEFKYENKVRKLADDFLNHHSESHKKQICRILVNLPQHVRMQFLELIKDVKIKSTEVLIELWPILNPEYKIRFLKSHLTELELVFKDQWEWRRFDFELDLLCQELSAEDGESADIIIDFILNTVSWDKKDMPGPSTLISYLGELTRFIYKRPDCDDILKIILQKAQSTGTPYHLLSPFFSKMKPEIKDQIIESWINKFLSENKFISADVNQFTQLILLSPLEKQREYLEKLMIKAQDNLYLLKIVCHVVAHLEDPLFSNLILRLTTILKDFGHLDTTSKVIASEILCVFLPLLKDDNNRIAILKNFIPKVFNSELITWHYWEYYKPLKELVPYLQLPEFKELREKLIVMFIELFHQHVNSPYPHSDFYYATWNILLLFPLISDVERLRIFTALHKNIFKYQDQISHSLFELPLLRAVAYIGDPKDIAELLRQSYEIIRQRNPLNPIDIHVAVIQSLTENQSQTQNEVKKEDSQTSFRDALTKNLINKYKHSIVGLNNILDSVSLSSQSRFDIAISLLTLLDSDEYHLDGIEIQRKLFKAMSPDQQVKLMEATLKFKHSDLCLAAMHHIYQSNLALTTWKPIAAIVKSYVA